MSPSRFLSLLAISVIASWAAAQTPLADLRFTYPNGIPFKADPHDGPRGIQVGYNRCNASTEGQQSMCQTFFTTSIDDFCLPGAPKPNSLVADVEGEMVAFCTKAGRGTRLIPDGALQGVQVVRAPGYISVVGYIDQTKINLQASDSGGELDPHGADGRGNPLGGLMFSQAYNNGRWTQITQWHVFLGGNVFCMKACVPGGQYDVLCDNVYDRIGCSYNVPANYAAINGTFQVCNGDNQLPPGIYVEHGTTMTYHQPAESLGPISTIPYQPQIPATSQCTTMTSAALYTDAARIAASSSSSLAAASQASATPTSVSRTSQSAGTPSRTEVSSNPTSTSRSASGATQMTVLSGTTMALALAMALMGGDVVR